AEQPAVVQRYPRPWSWPGVVPAGPRPPLRRAAPAPGAGRAPPGGPPAAGPRPHLRCAALALVAGRPPSGSPPAELAASARRFAAALAVPSRGGPASCGALMPAGPAGVSAVASAHCSRQEPAAAVLTGPAGWRALALAAAGRQCREPGAA